MSGLHTATLKRDPGAHVASRRRPRLVDVSRPPAVDVSQPIALASEPSRDHGLRFAQRMHAPRTLGLALGFLCVFATLFEQGAPAWMMVAAGA